MSIRFRAAVPALPVSDVRRSVEFYETVLGLTELTDDDGARLGILRRDDVEIQLWVPDGSAPGAETYLAGTGSCRVEVSGIDDVYAHCVAHGAVHPAAPLESQPWGTREFAVLDPDNNQITLYERLTHGA